MTRNDAADQMTGDQNLEAAIAHAVDVGRREAENLERRLQSAFREVERGQEELHVYADTDGLTQEARTVAADFLRTTGELQADVADLLHRQRETLDTFNIAFFGRTGAGKSSLMEALSRGSGEAISPAGQSDWTVDVRQVEWSACVLHDIPGINGWGRDRPREELEAVARRTVEVADLVVLAFDNQSQQAQEFEKVAAWVRAFGKPVVAVLNCRNPLWRFPPRVPSGRNRRQLSKAVQQHATNISAELAKIGLPDVAVVALHTKRAVFACAQDDYAGPDSEAFDNHRKTHGEPLLFRWSNLGALEALVQTALSADAGAIRLSMLHGQLRGALDAASKDWTTSRGRAVAVAEDLERTIETVLGIVGATDPAAAEDGSRIRELLGRKRVAQARRGAKRLQELERLRGGAFTIPRESDLARMMRHKLTAELGPRRETSLEQAMRAIDRALAERKLLSSEELRRVSFDEDAVNAATQRVVKAVSAYLEERVGRATDDMRDDLRARATFADDVDGTAGQRERTFGRVLELGALGGSATAALGGLALANAWNPLGWATATALVVGVVGGLVSSVFGVFSGKKRKEAERKRQQARSKARASTRKQVNGIFDDLERTLSIRCGHAAAEAARGVLEEPVEMAIALRRIAMTADEALRIFGTLLNELPPEDAAARALLRARSQVERARDVRRSHDLWLGEDWIAEGEGEATVSPLLEQPDSTMAKRLDAAWKRVASTAAPRSGRQWLQTAEAALGDDADARPVLLQARGFADLDRARVAVVGDYSAGKTTFLRRLLAEDYRRIPEELRTGGAATTAIAAEYGWMGVSLVDTPGLQSGDRRHDSEATQAILSAGALLYLFNPNLVVGRSDFLRLALAGDADRLRAPKAQRTIFVINRADELGVDPEDDPEGYRRLCESKRAELVRALAASGVTIDPSDVVCLAANPYGLVDDDQQAAPEDYARTRGWDGIRELIDGFRAHRADFGESGVDVAILEQGAAGLRDVSVELGGRRDAIAEQRRQLDRVIRGLQAAARKASAMEIDARVQLRRILEDHVEALWAEVLDSSGPERAAHIERLEAWWADESLQAEVDEWAESFAEAVRQWAREGADAVDRQLRSPAFRSAFPDLASTGLKFLRPRGRSGARDAARAAEKAAGALGDKQLVLDVFHKFGHKFKPWGATKTAAKFGKVSAAVGVVSLGWDVLSVIRAELNDRQSAARLEAAQDELRQGIDQAIKELADGDEQTPGPCAALTRGVQQLREQVDEARETSRRLRHEDAQLEQRVVRIEDVAASAWTALNQERPL
jgi:predicted GTPase